MDCVDQNEHSSTTVLCRDGNPTLTKSNHMASTTCLIDTTYKMPDILNQPFRSIPRARVNDCALPSRDLFSILLRLLRPEDLQACAPATHLFSWAATLTPKLVHGHAVHFYPRCRTTTRPGILASPTAPPSAAMRTPASTSAGCTVPAGPQDAALGGDRSRKH